MKKIIVGILFTLIPTLSFAAITVHVSPDRESVGISCDSPSDISGVPYISIQQSGSDISQWNTAYDNGSSLTGICDPIIYFYGTNALDPTLPSGSTYPSLDTLDGFQAFPTLLDQTMQLKVGSVRGTFVVCSSDGLFAEDISGCGIAPTTTPMFATSTIEQTQQNIGWTMIAFFIGMYIIVSFFK